MCVSLGGRGHITFHFDCLHWFVMGFLGQRNGKEIKPSFQSQDPDILKKLLCPRLDPMNQAAFGQFFSLFLLIFRAS